MASEIGKVRLRLPSTITPGDVVKVRALIIHPMDPFFTFTIRATDPGPVKVLFVDTTGGRYEGTAEIRFS